MREAFDKLGLGSNGPAVVGAVCTGLCVLFLARYVTAIIFADRHDERLGLLERRRRERLRAVSGPYRVFEPAIQALAASSFFQPKSASQQAKAAAFAGATRTLEDFPPWDVREFMATAYVQTLAVAILAALPLWLLFGPLVAGAVVLFAPVLFAQGQAATVREKARVRIAQILRRLPFAVDLMALSMESGAGFSSALGSVVDASREHALGQEFAKVVARMEHGEMQSVALEELRQRINDEDTRLLFGAINQGEKLGTPLAVILRKQADIIRLKASQSVERAAKEAEVRMSGPGFVIAIACMIIVAAPFVLKLADVF
jgi:Flp pilus assembly protein TadB